MARKSTYEELEQRVKELQNEVAKHKRAEKALRESEERYRLLVETMNDGLAVMDENMRLTFVNDRFCEILGYVRPELIGRPGTDLHDEANQRILREQIAKRRRGEHDTYEIAFTRKDGQEVFTIISPRPIVDTEGHFKGSFAVVTDITEYKEAEEALRESEAKYRQLFATVSDAIMVFDSDTKQFVDVNDAALRLYGYSKEEFLKLRHPAITAEPEKSVASIVKTLAGEVTRIPLRYHKKKDGTVFPVEISASTFTLGNRRVLCGVIRDITDRKRVEEELRKSEHKYRTLLEHIPQKIFHKDRNSVYLSCNDNYARDLKIKPEEIKGKTDYEFFPKKLAKKYRADDSRIIASRKTEDIEEKYIQDGQEIWVHTAKTPIKDEKGNVTGILGIFWDITQRKRAEEALREREAALEARTTELEETNRALRVLLKRIDEDKRELEEKVSLNIKELVVPYAKKLKNSDLDAKQMTYLSILESNLNDIISPFVYRLSSKYLGFTPTEIQVASLVRDGKTTKEIAELLNSSDRTIECHRRNIRMKTGIKKEKVNLRSFLLSM